MRRARNGVTNVPIEVMSATDISMNMAFARIPIGTPLMADRLGLPPRYFFYTLDQLASMLSVEEQYLKRTMLHYEGRSAGIAPRGKLKAINIAPPGEKPEWRVSENSLKQYLKSRGILFYERGYAE